MRLASVGTHYSMGYPVSAAGRCTRLHWSIITGARFELGSNYIIIEHKRRIQEVLYVPIL
jgi:hypothetical protein